MEEWLKVLLVEDNQIDQMAFERFVKREKLPYDYEICSSVSVARKILRAGQIDIMLLDYSLDDGIAFDLFDDAGDIPIIIVAGSGNEEIAVRAMAAGAADYLIKDPDSKYLITLPSTIMSAIDHKRTQDELNHYHERLEELVKERTEELSRTNELNRSITQTAADAIISINSDGIILTWNTAAENIFGYSSSEIVNKDLLEIIPTDYRIGHTTAVKRLKNRGKEKLIGQTIELTGFRKDGTEFPIELSLSSWVVEDQKYFTGIIRDITERVRAENALKNERDNLNRVFEAMIDGVYIVNKEYDIQYVNPVLIKDFGPYEGRKCYAYFHDRKEVCPWCKNPEVFNGETVHWEWYSAKNQRTYDLIDTPLRNPDGSIFKLEIFRDITERVQAQEAIRQERDKAQKYLDIAGVIMIALNLKGEITLINQKGCQIMGYQKEELIGVNWFDTCVPERDRKKRRQIFRKIIAGEAEFIGHNESPILTSSGEERTIAWQDTLIWDEKGHTLGTLSSGVNITERKRIEQSMILMSDTQNQISKKDDLAEIYQLIGKKIHELIGEGFVITSLYDEQIEAMKVVGVNGFSSFYENLVRKLKINPFKSVYYIKDMSASHLHAYRSGKLEEFEGDLYNLLTRKVPKQICSIAEKEFNFTGIYVIGFIWHNLDFGGVTIFPKSDITQYKSMIETIMNQASTAIKRIKSEENLRKSEQKLQLSLDGTIHILAATVEARDPYIAGHQKRVADLAGAIARKIHLSKDQVEGIRMGGIIHDLGKINVPAEILSKPGKLSELEFSLIKTHPQVGFDLLKEIEFPWPIAEMVHQHHEKIDGSGYPQGIKGEEILIEARVLAVADMVEAMSSHRPYRPALGIDVALNQIKKDQGTLLDPKVVVACLKIFKEGYKLLKN